VSIEPMIVRPHARELMAGIVRDPVFGPAIVFGAGGIAVEVLRDRAVALPPLNAALVDDMIRGTRVAACCGNSATSRRWTARRSTRCAARLGDRLRAAEIEELDINPIVATRAARRASTRACGARACGRRRALRAPRDPPYPAELA
jgi:acetyltransferase